MSLTPKRSMKKHLLLVCLWPPMIISSDFPEKKMRAKEENKKNPWDSLGNVLRGKPA